MKMLNKMFRKNGKAFTLVELVIVILIIAILAAVLIPQLSAMINKSKTAGVNEKFHEYQTAVMSVAVASENSDSMQKATASGTELTDKINGYLDEANTITATSGDVGNKTGANDPWGHAYVINYYTDGQTASTAAAENGEINAVQVVSYGPDGAANGGDDLKTTISWADGSYTVTTEGLAVDAK